MRLVVLSLIALPFLCTSAAFAQVQFPVQAPAIAVGDRIKTLGLDGLSKQQTAWREETVTAVDANGFDVSVKTERGEQPPARYDAHLNAVFPLKEGPETEIKIKFPLDNGKSWDSKWNWFNSARNFGGRMEMTYKVTGTERLKLPAGEFDTVVIDGQGRWYNTTAGSSGIVMEKRWYAPDAKRVVRRTWVTRFAAGGTDSNFIIEAAEVEVKK